MTIEQFGKVQTFGGTARIENHGNGIYAVYDDSVGVISTVSAAGVKTDLTGGIGFGTGFEVLTDGAFAVYGLSNYGQGSGAAVRLINADGSARTEFFDAAVGENIRGPTVAALADGGFVLGATSVLHGTDPVTLTFPPTTDFQYTSTTTGRGLDTVVRFFDDNGTGGGFTLTNTGIRSFNGATAPATFFDQRNDAILGLANGNAVEVFADSIAVGIPADKGGSYAQQRIISMRIVSENGSVSNNIQVNTEGVTNDVFNPASYQADGGGGEQVVSLGNAGFAVVWHEKSMVADGSVYGGYRFNGTDTKIRYFDINGNALTDEIQVVHRSPDLGNISSSVGLDALGDGRIALVYQDGVDGVNGNAAGQLFVSVLGPLGSSIETSAITPPPVAGRSYNSALDLASLGDGGFAVSYYGQDVPFGVGSGHVVTFGINEVLVGHSYGETLNGGFGRDQLSGLAGNDILNGKFRQDTLDGGAGNDVLNGGEDADTMRGGAGNDTYMVDNRGDRTFEAVGGGTDSVSSSVSYTLLAGQQIETLRLALPNTKAALNLTGNDFGQTITGNAGANVLAGKGGADLLNGLAGNDTFVFDTALKASNVDRIGGFSAADDTIRLDKSIFGALGLGRLADTAYKDIGDPGAKVDASDRILYDDDTGALYYDRDGVGGAAAVKFAILVNHPAVLTHSDFFVVA